jgi:hypothetical protein
MRVVRIVMAVGGSILLTLLAFCWVSEQLLDGMKRSHVKRTMADIRTIAAAWEARAAEVHTFDVVPRPAGGPVSVSYAELQRALEPAYVRRLPQRDIWNSEFRFTSTGAGYAIRSLSKDGRPDHVTGATTNFDCDIVFANGKFVEYPEWMITP